MSTTGHNRANDSHGADDLLDAVEGLAPDAQAGDLDALKDAVIVRHRDAVRRRFRRAALGYTLAAVAVVGGCSAGALGLFVRGHSHLPAWEVAVRDGGLSFLFWLGLATATVLLLTAWVPLFRRAWVAVALGLPLMLWPASLGWSHAAPYVAALICLAVIVLVRLRRGPMRRRVAADEAGAARASGLDLRVMDVLAAERRRRLQLRWLKLALVLALPMAHLLWWGATAEALRGEITRTKPLGDGAAQRETGGVSTHVPYIALAGAVQPLSEARDALIDLGAQMKQPPIAPMFTGELFARETQYVMARYPGEVRLFLKQPGAERGLMLAGLAGSTAPLPADGGLGTPPPVGHILLVARALCLAAEVDLATGRREEAVRKFNAAVVISSVPVPAAYTLPSQTYQVNSLTSVLEESLAGLERALADGDVYADVLVDVAGALKRAEGALRLRGAYRSMRTRSLRAARENPEQVAAVLLGRSPRRWTWLSRPATLARCRMALRQLENAMRALPPEGEARLAELVAMCSGKGFSPALDANVQALLPSLVPPLLRARMLRLAVALKRYRMDHGEAPAPSQGALVPTYLRAVPTDPFAGGPFTVERKDRTVTVRSAGPQRGWLSKNMDLDVTIRE